MAKRKPEMTIRGAKNMADNVMHRQSPVLRLIRGGKRSTYLLVGNDASGNTACYTYIGGQSTLRNLALAILEEVGKK